MAISKRTKLKRLNILVDMLNNHKTYFPKFKFDLENWAKNNKAGAKVECLLDGTCKTAACAIGSAMLFKPFNRMGLKGVYSGPLWNANISLYEGSSFVPSYGGEKGWPAVQQFFDISFTEAVELFDLISYSTNPLAKTVAKRVQKFIDNGFSI